MLLTDFQGPFNTSLILTNKELISKNWKIDKPCFSSSLINMSNEEKQKSALEQFGRDLTALARQGRLDPVIGRNTEIRRVIEVLSRRTKNNPVLIGEPGVGKTAIAEGLALRIVNQDVPSGFVG